MERSMEKRVAALRVTRPRAAARVHVYDGVGGAWRVDDHTAEGGNIVLDQNWTAAEMAEFVMVTVWGQGDPDCAWRSDKHGRTYLHSGWEVATVHTTQRTTVIEQASDPGQLALLIIEWTV